MDILKLRDFLQDKDVPDDTLRVVASATRASVENFLGYSIDYGEYTETFDAERILYLSHAPVEAILSIKVDGVEVASSEYTVVKRFGIIYLRRVPSSSVEVTYRGGYRSLPDNISSAMLITSQAVYQRLGSFGAKKESVHGYSVEYDDNEDLPREARRALRPFVRPHRIW